MEMPQNCDKSVVLAEWDSLAGEQLPLKSLTFDPDECSLSVNSPKLANPKSVEGVGPATAPLNHRICADLFASGGI